MNVSDLPALNASLNGLALVLLTLGFVFIRSGRREAHRRCMLGAFAASCVFLVTYVLHKILVHGVHTKIGATGGLKAAYYVMLFTHITLAVAIAGQLTGEIRALWRGPGTWIPQLIWYLLPNLSALNGNEALIYRSPAPAQAWVAALYGAAYVGTALALAVLVFERRDLP